MPVMLFTADHKAETIERIVDAVKQFEAEHGNPDVSFKLATGNVGVMAATNEAVAAAQWPIMVCVFGAIDPAVPDLVPLACAARSASCSRWGSCRCCPTR